MKKLIIASILLAVTFGLSGCHQKLAINSSVREYGNRYYYGPNNAQRIATTISHDSRAKWLNNRSKGLLNCRKNSMLYYAEFVDYEDINADHGNNIYEYAKDNRIRCIKPMSYREIGQYEEYLETQRKINNDPRVIAARIQANAIRQQQNNQAIANQWNYNNNPINYNTANNSGTSYYNHNNNSYSPVNNSTTYRATQVGDGLYRVKETRGAVKF